MFKHIGIAIGAGVTSAVLFAVVTTASLAGLVLASLAWLPIMIAGLGFTQLAGAIAAIVASGTVGLALGPVAGVLFAISFGLPGWYLSRLSLLGRRVSGTAPPTTVEWYPISQVLLRLAGLASLTVLLTGLAAIIRFHGYDHTVAQVARRIADMLDRDVLPDDVSIERIVTIMPLAMVTWTTVLLSLNLWLAARVVAISGRLSRPWPVLPDALRFPRLAAAALVALGVAAYFVSGAAGVAAGVLAAALAILFAFEGLATAHVLTRGVVARPLILAGIYLTTFRFLPWPLIALVLLGCIDCFTPLRGSGIKITKRTRS